MGKQDIKIMRTSKQNEILDLEKKYFLKLFDMINSCGFKEDLLLIEKEIKDNYPKYRDTWDLKNKIKIPAERLVRQHVYINFFEEIRGIYPSPVSSDLGIKLKDIVLCVDVKTLDTNSNENDIQSTAVEKNQTSFDNSNFPYINTIANLDSIDHYSRLPVLTYIIKIIYTDDGYSFKLSREEKPTLVLTCIPNGELSNLFDRNIIENFKTYDYYIEKDDKYKSIEIPKGVDENVFADEECINKRGFNKVMIGTSGRTIERPNKVAYIDPKSRIVWWSTSKSGKSYIRPLKGGSSTRFYNNILKARFDSENRAWDGYIEIRYE